MPRTTQYIGLNQRAIEYLKNNSAEELIEYIGDTGMFGEPLFYKVYDIRINCDFLKDKPNIFVTHKEVTQTVPWGGGPMYFTCLKNMLNGETVGEWTESEIDKIARLNHCFVIIDTTATG